MLDNEQIVEMNENVMKCFPEGKIVLLDGRVVDCYPRAGLAFGESVGQPIDSKPVKTDKEIEADMVRFIKNAFFFLANKERILTDSRMFLCPVPIQCGMSISGFENPTLGIYIQWWERCEGAMRTGKKGRRSLLYKLSGSSFSGHNSCGEVYEDGSTKNVELRPFWDYGKSFIHINNTYKSAKQKYQAYSLQQVLDILDHEEEGDCGYEHTINQQMQSHAITTLNYLISGMKIRNEELAHRYEELEKALFDERVLHFYDRYKDMERRIFAEMERLHQQKHDLEMALRRGDSSNQDYQRQIQIIIQRIKEAERELAGFKDEEILKAFPEQALQFWRIESYAQKLREK